MTAPAPLDLPALLDDLERAHAAATPGEWYVARRLHMFSDSTSHPGIGETYMPADAAAIVAEHNAIPTLIAELRKRDAALRAVEALADEWERGATRWEHPLPVPPQVAQVRAFLAAALSPESVQS